MEYIFKRIEELRSVDKDISYKLKANFIEIYNENIIDLMDDSIDMPNWSSYFNDNGNGLNSSRVYNSSFMQDDNNGNTRNRSLSNSNSKRTSQYISNFQAQKVKPVLREDFRKRVCVEGVQSVELDNMEECIKMLKKGSARRHISSTNCNYESSRSHTVFILN